MSHFDHAPAGAGSGHAKVILWQWVEQTSLECSMYENEPNPMTVTVESTLEGHDLDREAGIITGTKPLQFSGPTYGEVIHVDEKTSSGYAAHFKVSAKFAASAFGQFELWAEAGEGNSEYAEMEIVCEGNVEGHEPPPVPEPQPSQEHRGWGRWIEPFFEPEELL